MGEPEIVAAAISALLAIVAALIAGVVALWNEARRRRQERESVRETEVRLSAAEVFKEMFLLQHEIEWLTWHALHNPTSVRDAMFDDYDKAVHSCTPRLLGYLAILASLDQARYDRLVPIADELFTLDGEIGRLAVSVRQSEDRNSAIEKSCLQKQRVSTSMEGIATPDGGTNAALIGWAQPRSERPPLVIATIRTPKLGPLENAPCQSPRRVDRRRFTGIG